MKKIGIKMKEKMEKEFEVRSSCQLPHIWLERDLSCRF